MQTRQPSGGDLHEINFLFKSRTSITEDVCDKCVKVPLKLSNGVYYTTSLENSLQNS